MIRIQVAPQRLDGCVSMKQQEALSKAEPLLWEPVEPNAAHRERPAEVDEAIGSF